MKVWIDQNTCTGCSLCELLVPDVFTLVGGVARVKQGDKILPEGAAGKAEVPVSLEDDVVDAARETPGGCIFVEVA